MKIAGALVVLFLGGVGGVGCGDDLHQEDGNGDGLRGCRFSDAQEAEAPPQCAAPAQLDGQFDPREPGYVVQLHDGVDGAAETQRLAELHGFQPTNVYTFIFPGFAAELCPELREAIRCEASVQRVTYNAVLILD